jgi:lysophospholipid acyltransferase (LPLAT)-like uncharacterized protein
MKRKTLAKQASTHWLVPFLVSLLLRMIYLTARKKIIMPESAKPYMSGEKQAIFCFWHGRMILHPFKKPPGRDMRVLISRHHDGEIITLVLRWFGIGTVRGSTKKGGDIAIRELLQVVEHGDNISITPDGPKGPAFIAQHGAAYVAQKTGLPLVPISFGASRAKQFSSWDKFLLPRPFARIVFVVAEPITIGADDVIESCSQHLSDVMNRTMQEADRLAA